MLRQRPLGGDFITVTMLHYEISAENSLSLCLQKPKTAQETLQSLSSSRKNGLKTVWFVVALSPQPPLGESIAQKNATKSPPRLCVERTAALPELGKKVHKANCKFGGANMEKGLCRICGCGCPKNPDRRCRLCRTAKAATDSGTSYGRMKAALFEKFGEMEELPEDFYMVCPVCKRLFVPSRYNQIYDSNRCAQKAASKRYYKKKHSAAGHRTPGNLKGVRWHRHCE